MNFITVKTHLLRSARALLAATIGVCAVAYAAPIAPGALAPDFTLRTLGGPNMRLQEQRGRVVLVNFWATWCAPCRQEMPHLNKLHDKYGSSGFVLLGVNVDDDTKNAVDLATKLGLKFPVSFDNDKKVSRLYDLSAMPSTVLIDREGRVRYVHRGYRDGFENTYDQQIRGLLKE
ncbi:MAG: TlpA disulfide reductase family protein [Burkholderiales bacterium]|nr:TlpA disulfide reductase family protein [Burkholderiales bacterium]